MKHLFALVLVAGAALSSAGCFDDPYGHGSFSVNRPDADPNDIPPGKRGIGTMLLLETTFFDYPESGSGLLTLFGPFYDKDEWDAVWEFEEAEGSPFACKVWSRTRDEYFNRGDNPGTFDININLGGVEMPPCKLVDSEIGWACIGAEGTGADIAVVDSLNGIMSLTSTGAGVSFTAGDVGRILVIDGATTAANNGEFFIVANDGDDTIHFKNPAGVEELASAALHFRTFAGRGPGGGPPRIGDEAEATVNLITDGASDTRYEDFRKVAKFGNEFELDDASKALMQDFPMDGREFSFGCNGTGGSCGTSIASSIDVETTDAEVDPAAPLGIYMGLPPPVNKSVQPLCIFLTGEVVVPAEASQFIADSGAKRIRTMFLRAEATDNVETNATTTIVAGHAVGAFTDLP